MPDDVDLEFEPMLLSAEEMQQISEHARLSREEMEKISGLPSDLLKGQLVVNGLGVFAAQADQFNAIFRHK